VRVASSLASMEEEQQQAKVRAAAAVAESKRLLREERKREERRIQDLREEAEREERRIQSLREDVERAVQQRRLHEEHLRCQEEREQEQLRLRTLQAERENQWGLVQEAARTVAPHNATARGDPSAESSLRASQALASRQGQDSRSTMLPAWSLPHAATASRQNSSITRSKPSRYDGVEDDELNWRLDSQVSLSDYTIIVNRAKAGPYAPDFETTDLSGINFVTGSYGEPKKDIYFVHKAMIAVGSRRSELLGRRIREAENSRGSALNGHSFELDVHETIMLESAANAMSVVLDFCYNPDCSLDVNVENAVPLVYLGKRYKIRALLEQAEAYIMDNIQSNMAMHYLLDSYLFRLEEILGRAIEVTAANLADTVDFEPIYKLPPDLFRRIILSKELNCDSDLLSLIVFSYCGERECPNLSEDMALAFLLARY
jgi:hypothetical protein